MKVILYQKGNGELVILSFHPKFEESQFIELGKKYTPSGLPFWKIDNSVLPPDKSMREAWRLDGTEGPPDGFGEMT
jgi:hypothetical protein